MKLTTSQETRMRRNAAKRERDKKVYSYLTAELEKNEYRTDAIAKTALKFGLSEMTIYLIKKRMEAHDDNS